MLRDLGSRDREFIALVADVRRRLVALADADPAVYTAVPMQGSGTFAIESVIGSAIPPDGRLLVLVNGAYGERMVQIARRLSIEVVALRSAENAGRRRRPRCRWRKTTPLRTWPSCTARQPPAS